MWKLKFKTILFTTATNKFKYLSIYLKYVQDLFTENLKMLMKEIKGLNSNI